MDVPSNYSHNYSPSLYFCHWLTKWSNILRPLSRWSIILILEKDIDIHNQLLELFFFFTCRQWTFKHILFKLKYIHKLWKTFFNYKVELEKNFLLDCSCKFVLTVFSSKRGRWVLSNHDCIISLKEGKLCCYIWKYY